MAYGPSSSTMCSSMATVTAGPVSSSRWGISKARFTATPSATRKRKPGHSRRARRYGDLRFSPDVRRRCRRCGRARALDVSESAMIPQRPEARYKPLPQPPTQGSRRVARDAEWQTKIVFANDVPAFPRRHADRRVARNVPAVVFEAADQPVAGGPQKPVLLEAADVIFEQDQSRLPAREIESAQDLELVAFDIDRQQIEPRRRASFDQNVVERPHGYFNDPLGFHTRCHPVAIERRQG